jgi:hypothetical protein
MTRADPVLSVGSTLLGLLLMVPLIWLPEWTIGAGMIATVVFYASIAYRRRIVFSLLEMICLVVFWPVALALPAMIRLRNWHQRGHYLRFGCNYPRTSRRN